MPRPIDPIATGFRATDAAVFRLEFRRSVETDLGQHRGHVRMVEAVTRGAGELVVFDRLPVEHSVHEPEDVGGVLLQQRLSFRLMGVEHHPGDPVDVVVQPPGQMVQ